MVQQLTSISNWVHHQHHRRHHPLPHGTPVTSNCLQTYEIVSYHWKQNWCSDCSILPTSITNSLTSSLPQVAQSHVSPPHYCRYQIVHTVMILWIHCWAVFGGNGRPPTDEVYHSTILWRTTNWPSTFLMLFTIHENMKASLLSSRMLSAEFAFPKIVYKITNGMWKHSSWFLRPQIGQTTPLKPSSSTISFLLQGRSSNWSGSEQYM